MGKMVRTDELSGTVTVVDKDRILIEFEIPDDIETREFPFEDNDWAKVLKVGNRVKYTDSQLGTSRG